MINVTDDSLKAQTPQGQQVLDRLREVFSIEEVEDGVVLYLDFDHSCYVAVYDYPVFHPEDKVKPEDLYWALSSIDALKFTRDTLENFLVGISDWVATVGKWPDEWAYRFEAELRSDEDKLEQHPLPKGFVNCEDCELYDSCFTSGYCPHENNF